MQVDNDKDGAFFQAQAGIIMARLLRAAAIDGRGMAGVIDWATDLKAAANRAVQILKRDPVTENWGTTLHTAITGADETVSSVRMTMAQKIEPFLNPVVMRQLIPAPGVEMFDPADVRAVHGHPDPAHRRPGADQRRPVDDDAAERGHGRRETRRRDQ